MTKSQPRQGELLGAILEKKMKDDLGDRMKLYESAEAGFASKKGLEFFNR